MKKFFKNAIIIMLVSCFIFNIINLIWLHIEHYTILQNIVETAKELSKQTITGQETYQVLASFYQVGYGNKMAIQTGIILLSILLGITIGLVITFEEKSKIRVLLMYLFGLLLTSLVPTICESIYYVDLRYFFNDIIYYLEITWKWYTLVFILMYAIKIYIDNKKTKKLNEILNNKNKSEN